ncbi:MAG: alpha/beta hydrolase, partial [Dehalococcoidia bacterium]|nr:alpha/beta hydrolase [Dehalococcoidia bacterium]
MREDFIFFPDSYFIGDPAGWGLPFEDIYFPTADGVTLHGWFVPGQTGITWLWCHGNAGNISYRLDNLKLLHDKLALNIFIFDYRGYGRSQGKPSEEGTYRDAEAAVAHLRIRKDIDQDAVIIFGRSLGGAIAVDLASKHQFLGLILESTFSSLAGMFPYLPADAIPIKYDSLAKIKQVRMP